MRRVASSIVLVVAMLALGLAPAGAVSHPAATVSPAITSGRLHSCGLMAVGTVVCWGDNTYGELGINSIIQSPVPVKVHGVGNVGFLSGVTALTAGNGFTCALLAATTVDCWGYGGDGEMGVHSSARALVPVKVHGVGNVGLLTGVTAITAGNGFACARLATKTVDCWGANTFGELGTHSTTRATVPVRVHGVGNAGFLTGVATVSAGSGDTPCALLAARNVVCWGASSNGELGDNSVAPSSVPVKVHGVGNTGLLGGVKAITGAGTNSSCALLQTGTVDCWGFNGSLGVSSTFGNSLTPMQVLGVAGVGTLTGVSAISDHGNSPCALLATGGVDCWGIGNTHLGDGGSATGNVPVQVHAVDDAGTLSDATGISEGEGSSCALLTGGSVACWGANANGELGDGTVNDSPLPVQVRGVANVGFLTL